MSGAFSSEAFSTDAFSSDAFDFGDVVVEVRRPTGGHARQWRVIPRPDPVVTRDSRDFELFSLVIAFLNAKT